jgi:serine/threonine-protein kinase PknK
MLSPPRAGPDGRARYSMLETLRAYGARQLAETGGEREAADAVAGFAVGLAEEAATGLKTTAGELAATRLLEAEDATVHWALAWALEHDQGMALRLAIALAPWWFQSGRWAFGHQMLAAAAADAAPGGEAWCAVQFWLGLLTIGSAVPASLSHLTAVRDALAGRAPVPMLAQALAFRAGALANLGHIPDAAKEARRALTLARELSDPAGETCALIWLGFTASYTGDFHGCAAWLRQVQRIDQTAIPGWIARQCTIQLAGALGETGETAQAQHYCAEALAGARQVGALYDQGDCLQVMADLDLHAGKLSEARAHLREALELYPQTSAPVLLINCLSRCGYLCAASQRWREAITVWAACDAVNQATIAAPGDQMAFGDERREPLQRARELLGPTQASAAEERGAAMTLATAADYALLLVTEEPEDPAASPGLPRLSARERELVTLVARGRTDAQIAEQLYISIRTVRSHLDRIRDKSGCRRRADLTRLALETGLV